MHLYTFSLKSFWYSLHYNRKAQGSAALKKVIEVLSKLKRSFHFLVVAGLLGSSDVSQHKVLGDSKLEAIPFCYRCSFEKDTAPQFKAQTNLMEDCLSLSSHWGDRNGR